MMTQQKDVALQRGPSLTFAFCESLGWEHPAGPLEFVPETDSVVLHLKAEDGVNYDKVDFTPLEHIQFLQPYLNKVEAWLQGATGKEKHTVKLRGAKCCSTGTDFNEAFVRALTNHYNQKRLEVA